jgi:ABC-type uncharacterized transport system substrate-binding protein
LLNRPARHRERRLEGVHAGSGAGQFVINLRAAKALGILIPKMLLAGADQVIE